MAKQKPFLAEFEPNITFKTANKHRKVSVYFLWSRISETADKKTVYLNFSQTRL